MSTEIPSNKLDCNNSRAENTVCYSLNESDPIGIVLSAVWLGAFVVAVVVVYFIQQKDSGAQKPTTYVYLACYTHIFCVFIDRY